MNWCEKIMEKYDYETQMKYYLKPFNESSEITFDPNTFREALDWRIKFKRLANQCVNLELKRQYSIMGYSAVEYCVSNQEHDPLGRSSSPQSFAFSVIMVAFCRLLGRNFSGSCRINHLSCDAIIVV